jgi:hypothetical protein
MFESLLSGVSGAFGSGGSGLTGAPGNMPSTATAGGGGGIVVAPQGINLGAILAPLNEGNPETGGYDIDLLSRMGYGPGGNVPVYTAAGGGFNFGFDMGAPSTWLMIGGALIGVLLIAKKGR